MHNYFTKMKTVQQKLKWNGMIGIAVLLATLLSSCIKHNDDTAQASTANLAVIDISPNAPLLDFYIDGSQLNSTSIVYGGGLEYFSLNAGVRNAVFNQTGTTTKIAADTITLTANRAYTLLLSNVVTAPDITLLTDSLFVPPTGAATVRFVNGSPDAGAADFGVKGQSLLASNIAYRKYTSFKAIQLIGSADTLQMYKTGTSTVLISLPVSLQQGGVYTVYLNGFASQTNSEKLGAGIMENIYYY
jgi:hypothetical protein